MKRLLLLLTIFYLTACTKDYSFEGGQQLPQPPIVVTPQKLAKTVTKSSTDSLVYEYSYNTAGQLVQINFASYGQVKRSSQISINRDATGIKSFTFRGSDLVAYGADSILYQINSTQSKYTSRVAKYIKSLVSYTDSVVYTYTGSRINSEVWYLNDKPISKSEYQYSAEGNLINLKNYKFNTTTSQYDLASEQTFTYDSHKAPLVLNNEAFLIERIDFVSANNPLKRVYKDYVSPSSSATRNYTYTYNQSNRPDVLNAVFEGTNAGAFVLNYYYK